MSLEVSFRQLLGAFLLDVAFTAAQPGVTMLFGASGAGKSSVVSVVAGLQRPSGARVVVDGVDLAKLPPERRRIGMVFQDARLFPHMSVLRNLRYGWRRTQPADRRITLDEVVALLGIDALLARSPRSLSGGERQRVAIGRALLSQPRLLVMDEPLASLDAPRKAEILPYLARLKQAGLPILYVTHSFEEVARLADTLVLIDRGRVTASGRLTDIAASCALPPSLRDEAGAVLAARIVRHDPPRRLTLLDAGGVPLLVPLLAAEPGRELRVRIPAREVILATHAPQGISVQNILPGAIRAVGTTEDGLAMAIEVLIGQAVLLARITTDAAERLGLAKDQPVLALVKSTSIIVLL